MSDLPKSGGMVSLVAILMFAAMDANYDLWIRVVVNALTACACLLLCSALIRQVMNSHGDARILHSSVLAASVTEAGLRFYLSWRWFTRSTSHLPLWATVFQCSTVIVLVLYLYSTRHSLQLSYEPRTEEERRDNLHRIEQVSQASVLLDHKVNTQNLVPPELINHGRGN